MGSVARKLPSFPLSVANGGTGCTNLADVQTLLGVTTVTGAVFMHAGATAPTGWLLCDGTSYLRSDYATLFSVIGTTFGSADGTHFNVPDMRGRIPIGVGTGAGGGTYGNGLPSGGSALTARALGAWTGEETHTLLTAESGTPTHSHADAVSFVSTESANHTHTVSSTSGGPSATHYHYYTALMNTSGTWQAGTPSTWISIYYLRSTSYVYGNHQHSITVSTNNDSGTLHSHTITMTNATKTAADAASGHPNVAPIMSFNFIIKT